MSEPLANLSTRKIVELNSHALSNDFYNRSTVPDNFRTTISGDGTIGAGDRVDNERGIEVNADGDGDQATIHWGELRAGRNKFVGYWEWGSTGDPVGGEAKVGLFRPNNQEGIYVDLAENEYSVDGTTTAVEGIDLTDTTSRRHQLWILHDSENDHTEFILTRDRTTDHATIPEAATGNEYHAVCSVSDTNILIEFGVYSYTPLLPKQLSL